MDNSASEPPRNVAARKTPAARSPSSLMEAEQAGKPAHELDVIRKAQEKRERKLNRNRLLAQRGEHGNG